MAEPGTPVRVPARYVARLLDFLESIGVDRARLLRAARIRSIEDPSGQVGLPQVELLLRAATEASQRTDVGFELGRRLDLISHDILGFALMTSPTFGDMLRLATSYQRLIQTVFALSMQRHAQRVELVYLPAAGIPPLTMGVVEEAIVVSNHVAYQAVLGDRLPAYDARLSIERPIHAHRYRELGRVRVHFGEASPGVRIELPSKLLQAPLAMADARAMRAAEERCKTMLMQVAAHRRWTEWCRMMLNESRDARPTLEQLARIGNQSSRTLARHLEAEGTSFRELALQVRTSRATRMLEQAELSVTQVAYRLGYSDVTSFVRSYRKETGVTPGSVQGGRSRSLPAPDGAALPTRPAAKSRSRR